MAISELFGHGNGLSVGVQATPFLNVSAIDLIRVRVENTGSAAQRRIIVQFLVDGEAYELELLLTDDTYDARTLTGGSKEGQAQTRNPVS